MTAYEQVWIFCFGLAVGLGIWSIYAHSIIGGVAIIFVFSLVTMAVRDLV